MKDVKFTPVPLLLSAALLGGCSPYAVHDLSRPLVDAPEAFSAPATEGVTLAVRWWQEFQASELDSLVELALRENLDLRQAWSRLRQAAAQARISGAELYPQIDASAGASSNRTVDREAEDPFGGTRRFDETDERYFVGAGLTYEIDLWRRIASQTKAGELRLEASREDVEATALVLSGAVTVLWLSLLEQETLIRLIEQQVATGEQFRELTELRFSVGSGSAVDVLQQRQQVAATRSELPPARSLLETTRHELAVLVGAPPTTLEMRPDYQPLPELPPVPRLPSPEQLFQARPDLRSEMLRLQAADYDVAQAVAERLPRLSLSLSYDFSATSSSRIFRQEAGSIAGNLIAPLVDGGRRRAEVERRKAFVEELLDGFGQRYLDVLLEIEDAITEERYQLEFIDRLEEELGLARQTLEESRVRYANGLEDYLSVLVALQSLQGLERRIVSERRRLLVTRSTLYRALGGKGWTSELEAPESRELAGERQGSVENDA